MRFPLPTNHIPTSLENLWSSARASATDLFVPSLRLGVTGLARAGKTVFISALVRNLVSSGRLPFFNAYNTGRILSAHLEPQPDDQIPRFDYEQHIDALTRDPPSWPESTRRISQLRIAITYRPQDRFKRLLSETRRLNLDIIDYPGEWLLDLEMLTQDFAGWSSNILSRARRPSVAQTKADTFNQFLSTVSAMDPDDEQVAIRGAELFTAYLRELRSVETALTVGPGRFLMPGDLEGSPLLTFFPLPMPEGEAPLPGTLAARLSSRYDSYLTHVVRPFFRDHFSRLNRQVVLIDVLTALNNGPAAIQNQEETLTSVLRAFRTGLPSWFAALVGKHRIDRILFAATKADHIHHTSHDRLENILDRLTERAEANAAATGAETSSIALSAIRATHEAEARVDNETLPCIVGIPLPGETIAKTTFDGTRETAIFPGDLPENANIALEKGLPANTSFPRFRPPKLTPEIPDGPVPPMPHIRLDKALEFLVGDYLT